MPLSALADGEPVVGMWLDDDRWDALRDGSVRLTARCCGQPMHTRVSSRGLRHFVHRRRVPCEQGPETAQHLAIKAQVADVARRAGWQVQVEAGGDGWRADVLAVDGDRRVAFEAQWSAQSHERHSERTKRLVAAGLQPVWLYQRPSRPRRRPAVPAWARSHAVGVTVEPDDTIMVFVHDRWLPAAEFVGAVLARRMTWRDAFPVQQPHVILLREDPYCCHRCGLQGRLLSWHADACCDHGVPGAISDGPTRDNDELRRLIGRAQADGRLPGSDEHVLEPVTVELWDGNVRRPGWRCTHCNARIVRPWETDDEPSTPSGAAAVWALTRLPVDLRLLTDGVGMAGPAHWCTSPVDPDTLGGAPVGPVTRAAPIVASSQGQQLRLL